jgi:hypothetical protein
MVLGIVAMPNADAEHLCRDDQLRTLVPSLARHRVLIPGPQLTPIPDHVRGADASRLLESEIWRV